MDSFTEVTNAQDEQFDPQHKQLRGKLGDPGEDRPAPDFSTGAWIASNHAGFVPLADGRLIDGVIHLISSRQHYAFNLAWRQTPPPAPPEPVELDVKAKLQTAYPMDRLPSQSGWRYNGTNVPEADAVTTIPEGIRLVTGPGQRVRIPLPRDVARHPRWQWQHVLARPGPAFPSLERIPRRDDP